MPEPPDAWYTGLHVSAFQFCRKYVSDSKKLLQSPQVRDYAFLHLCFSQHIILKIFQSSQKWKEWNNYTLTFSTDIKSLTLLRLLISASPSLSLYVFNESKLQTSENSTPKNSTCLIFKNRNVHPHNHKTKNTDINLTVPSNIESIFKFSQWGILWTPASQVLSYSGWTQMAGRGQHKASNWLWWSPRSWSPFLLNLKVFVS